MRSRSPTAPSRQHALPGFRRDHRSLGAAPRTPPEESCRSLRHPGRTMPPLGEGVRTPGKFRKFAEFQAGSGRPGASSCSQGQSYPACTGTSRGHRVGGGHGRRNRANTGRAFGLHTVRWTARIAREAIGLLRAPSGPAAGNPAAMGRRVRPHRPRGNPPFQVAGYVRRRRCNGRQVEDRPTLGTKPPERQRCRSGGAHRVTQPY